MKKNTRTVILPLSEAAQVEALLAPESRMQKTIKRMVARFSRGLNYDAAEVRSICYAAALKAVQTYSGKKSKSKCNCGEKECSTVLRAAVRIARNNLLNAVEATQAKKRGGGATLLPIETHGRTKAHESGSVGHQAPLTDDGEASGDYHTSTLDWEIARARDAFRLGSPLTRVIGLQMQEQIKRAYRRLTVPQSAILRLALEPSARVRARARQLESAGLTAPFVRAAQEAVKGTDFDRLAVEGTIRSILSL